MSRILTRAMRAAMVQRNAFKEAFFDSDSAADGAILAALVGAVVYIGQLLVLGSLSAFDIRSLLAVVIGSVISWLILAFATWAVARWLFEASSRPQTMIGVHGLTLLPLLFDLANSRVLGAVGLVWYLALLVIATQETTDLDLKKSGVSVLIGFAVAVLVRALLNAPFAAFSSLF